MLLKQRIRRLRWQDFIAVFPMAIGKMASWVVRKKRPNLWLIAERSNEARDNGYWFFKYLREEQPQEDAVFVIEKASVDYEKVAQLGATVEPGTLRHWIYFFAAKYNVCTQKEGNPNAALCFFLENILCISHRRYFLQHGVLVSHMMTYLYDQSHFDFFACSSPAEAAYVSSHYGYGDKVHLTGLCRFDDLHAPLPVKKQILVMSTWREWLMYWKNGKQNVDGSSCFSDSQYCQHWNAFLKNPVLEELLTKHNITLYFFTHPKVQKHIQQLTQGVDAQHIVIANSLEHDVHTLLKESALLITDYSSVHADFAYMQKPMLYYQFDYPLFRQHHHAEGYFSFLYDGFGPVSTTENELIQALQQTIENDQLVMQPTYLDRSKAFFTWRDDHNCQRTYEAIKQPYISQ